MALSEYVVIRRGVELTMMLTEEDALAAGATLAVKSADVENKAKKVANRAAQPPSK